MSTLSSSLDHTGNELKIKLNFFNNSVANNPSLPNIIANDIISVDNHTDLSVSFTPIISDHLVWWVSLFGYAIFGQIMSVFGVLTNTVNVIVFVKLGMKDPMNVSLLGLSVSDFMSCLSITWFNLCMTPWFQQLDNLPFDPIGLRQLLGAWMHILFVKVTLCITCFITVERCLCVTHPLKIRDMMTTKIVGLITIAMFVGCIVMTSPMFYLYRLDWVYFPSRNRSIFTLVFAEDRAEVEAIFYPILTFSIPPALFIVTVIATVILVHTLKKNAKWRISATTATITYAPSSASSSLPSASTSTDVSQSSKPENNKGDYKSSRDFKVAKTVVLIAVLFIVCSTPVHAYVIAMVLEPRLNEGLAMENLHFVCLTVIIFLESVNASMNIFIYYSMSSNYKAMVDQIFLRKLLNK